MTFSTLPLTSVLVLRPIQLASKYHSKILHGKLAGLGNLLNPSYGFVIKY